MASVGLPCINLSRAQSDLLSSASQRPYASDHSDSPIPRNSYLIEQRPVKKVHSAPILPDVSRQKLTETDAKSKRFQTLTGFEVGENWHLANNGALSRHDVTHEENERQSVGSLQRSLWNETTSQRSYPASTNTTSVLPPTRTRKFYGREWVFSKILKYLRSSLRDDRLGTCLDTSEVSSISETVTTVSEVEISSRMASQNTPAARTIVIVGGPGSGKTTICRRIVDTFRNLQCKQHSNTEATLRSSCVQVAEHLLCVHFCSMQLADTLEPYNFVQSVHRQLASEHCPLREKYLQALGDNNAECGTWLQCGRVLTSTSESFRHGVLTALSKISSLTPASSVYKCSEPECALYETTDRVHQYLLIVDGLDESEFNYLFDSKDNASQDRTISTSSDYPNTSPSCMDQSLASFRRNHSISELLVDNLAYFPPWMSLLLTCRRQHRNTISRLFPGVRRISIDDLHRSFVGHDVQQYILSRLSDERNLQHALRVHMHSDVLSLLRIKSSACLLYLETLLDGIADEWIAPDELASIPGTLNGLYLWLCQRMCCTLGEKSSTSAFNKLRPLLEVLLSSNSTVSEEDLYKILSFSYPDLDEFTFHDRLRVLSRVLIAVDAEEERTHFFLHFPCTFEAEKTTHSCNKIHFFHPSFAEWLLDVKHCTHAFLCDKFHGAQLIDHSLNRSAIPNHAATQSEDEAYQESMQDTAVGLTANLSPLLSAQDQQGVEFFQSKTFQTLPEVLDSSFCYYYTNHTGDGLNSEYIECPFKNKPTGGSTEPHSIVLAARKGEFAQVESLLRDGTDPNEMDEDGWSALRTAAWRGHADIVELLLRHGASVNLSGSDGRSALRAAAWAGHEEIVQRLIDAGADVDIQDAEGRSPLIAAAYMGHVGVVELLAQAGADLNHADEDGRTALHVATFCVRPSETHLEVVSCLLEYGANPNVFDSEGLSPLLGAARVGNQAVCELCLEADTDVNQTDKFGNTALSLAVLGGHIAVVRLLLFWGATVDVMDSGGRSLLSLAAATGNTLIVQELLARGLDEAHRDHSGCAPLHLAAAGPSSASLVGYEQEVPVEQYCSVIKILLDGGARLEDTDNSGRTPLLIACEGSQIEIAKLLVSYSTAVSTTCSSPSQSELPIPSDQTGIQTSGPLETNHLPTGGVINQPSLDHETPLRAAALANNPDLVSLLLSVGADPDYQDSYGRTVLYMLALEGVLEMASLLLHTPSPGKAHSQPGSITMVGANPILADDEGRCPLHVATWQGHLAMVRLLLQAGTPVDIRDREGRTPLHLAAWQGHTSVCHALLTEANAKVDAACSQGATALCIAAQEGHLEVCTVLLEAGANPYQADSHGRTPYCVALKANHFEICELLETTYGIGLSGRLACSTVVNFDSHSATSAQSYPNPIRAENTGAAFGMQPVISDTSMISGPFVPLCSASTSVSYTKAAKVSFDDANPYSKPSGPLVIRQAIHSAAEMYEQNILQPLAPEHERFSPRKSSPASLTTSGIGDSHLRHPFHSPHQTSNLCHSASGRYHNESNPQPTSQFAINPHGYFCLPAISEVASVEIGNLSQHPNSTAPSSKVCSTSGQQSAVRTGKPSNHVHMEGVFWSAAQAIQPNRAQLYYDPIRSTTNQDVNQQVSSKIRVQRRAIASNSVAQFVQTNKASLFYSPYDGVPHPMPSSVTHPDRIAHPFQQHELLTDIRCVKPRGLQPNSMETTVLRCEDTTIVSTKATSPIPVLFPEHCVISPTKRREKCGQPMSTRSGELAKQSNEAAQLHSSRDSDSPRQIYTENKGMSARAALAGMFGLGSRRGKKVNKKNQQLNVPDLRLIQPSHGQKLIPPRTPSPHIGHMHAQTRHHLRQNSQSRSFCAQQHYDSSGSQEQHMASFGVIHGRGEQDSTRTSNSSVGVPETVRSASSSVQFEAIARRLACCSMMEELPPQTKTSHVANTGKSPHGAVKPCSPQTWTNQNSSKEKSYNH